MLFYINGVRNFWLLEQIEMKCSRCNIYDDNHDKNEKKIRFSL